MNEQQLQELISELQSGNDRQRRASSYKLGKSKSPLAIPALINAYNDSDSSVRRNVIEGLRAIGTQEATGFLNSHNIQSVQVVHKNAGTSAKATPKVTKGDGQKNMLYGALWCIGGIVATAVGYSNASSGGGTYYVFWGAIIFGGIQFLQGLYQFSTAPDFISDNIKIEHKFETLPDPTNVVSDKNPALDKLGAYVTELPEVSDEGINNFLQQLQNPMAYIRESALNDVSRTKIDDPRIIGAIEILATSDHVDSIRDIAKRTLSILGKEANTLKARRHHKFSVIFEVVFCWEIGMLFQR